MPTFRLDLKLGTKVPQMKTDDYNDRSVTERKLADGAVTVDKLAPDVVNNLGIGMQAISNIEIDNVWEEK